MTRPLLSGAWRESHPRISPDGRWLAYVSDESGTPEAYLRRFEGLALDRQVAVLPGESVHDLLWTPDGRSLVLLHGERSSRTWRSANLMLSTEVGGTLSRIEVSPEGLPGKRIPIGDIEGNLIGVGPESGRLLVGWYQDAGGPASPESHLIVITNWWVELLERTGKLSEGGAP